MGKILTFLMAGCLFIIGCSDKKPTPEQIQTHQSEIEAWQKKRIAHLKSHDGWLNLAGLFWLKDGFNSFGSDSTNDIIFPSGKMNAKEGYFSVKGQVVTMIPLKGSSFKETLLFHPDSTKPVIIYHDSLQWFIIRRDDKLGIRLRDFQSENLNKFEGINTYPIDYSWKIPAKFEPSKNGETIDITNVLGQVTTQALAGTYVFEIDGKEQRLSATPEGEQMFVVFGDDTNGKETYGAGRFIYLDKPDSTGTVFIDFNKAYNPPCAFTEFATCPLPPKQNVLAVAITAGEKNYDSHGK